MRRTTEEAKAIGGRMHAQAPARERGPVELARADLERWCVRQRLPVPDSVRRAAREDGTPIGRQGS